MATERSRFRQGAQDLAAAFAGIWDWLTLLPFLVVLIAMPIWWGYGFISHHLLESALGVFGLLVLAGVWAVRRRAKSKDAGRSAGDESSSHDG